MNTGEGSCALPQGIFLAQELNWGLLHSRWILYQLSYEGSPLRSKPCHTWITCMPSHFSHIWLFVTPWTIAHQAPLSMGFSRHEYWSGLPCPPLGDLSDPGILCLLYWQLGSLPLAPPGKPYMDYWYSRRVSRQFNGEKTVFSGNDAEKTGYPYAVEWRWTHLMPYTKNNKVDQRVKR